MLMKGARCIIKLLLALFTYPILPAATCISLHKWARATLKCPFRGGMRVLLIGDGGGEKGTP